MRRFADCAFEGRRFDGAGVAACDVECRGCTFQGCSILAESPESRSVCRNVRLIGCDQRGCGIHGTVFEDVLVEDFNTHGQLVLVFGAVFNRVTLRGRIGRLKIDTDCFVSSMLSARERHRRTSEFRSANAAYYGGVEWALDIRDTEFTSAPDILGIPGRLIRRDPETQVLVERRRLEQVDWSALDFEDASTAYRLAQTIKDGRDDQVIVAPKRGGKFKQSLADFRLLRAAGLVAPD
ncbi:MAG: hypothetical protein H6809_06675 [Phycisphaeraceae bacterium]|nr:hypothetical protein [Phycisphaeraceae bacterium]